jgi:hypothetical protein
MGQPSVIYKPGPLKYVWNYLGKSLKDFAAALSPYLTGGSSYKVYSALLTQIGGDDPTAMVLENTLDAEVIWYRQAQGIYYAESFGTWKTDKTAMIVGPLPDLADGVLVSTKIESEDQAYIVIQDVKRGPADDSLFLTFIEIRVYN